MNYKMASNDLWYVGVILYLIGTISMAGGINIQKLSLNLNEKKAPEQRRTNCLQPLWVFGILLYTASGILMSLALGFSSQTMVAPLMSMVLISNIIFAHFLLGERITVRDLIATVVIAISIIVVVISTPQSNPSYDQAELITLFQSVYFIAFIVGWGAIVAGMMTLLFILKRRVAADPMGTSDTTLVVLGFAHGAIAGLWGGLCVTLMKSALEIIVGQFTNSGIVGVLSSWLMWLLLIALIVAWVSQLLWINLGLKHCPAMFIVSLEAIFNELTAIVGGLLYFQEFAQFDTNNAILFSVGMLLGLFGVAILVTREQELSFTDADGDDVKGVAEGGEGAGRGKLDGKTNEEKDPPKRLEMGVMVGGKGEDEDEEGRGGLTSSASRSHAPSVERWDDNASERSHGLRSVSESIRASYVREQQQQAAAAVEAGGDRLIPSPIVPTLQRMSLSGEVVGTATSPNGTPSGPSTCGKGVSGVASANREEEEGGEEGRKNMEKVVDDDAASVASAASVR